MTLCRVAGPCRESTLETLGFKLGLGGVHMARTLLAKELAILLNQLPQARDKTTFSQAVLEGNILSKSTASSRKRTFEHLVSLYGLDVRLPIFRLLRYFWNLEPFSPRLVMLVAARARDPLLQLGTDFLLPIPVGGTYDRIAFENHVNGMFPNRFSAKMCRSLTQNIASTFTQAGFFEGKVKKVRCQPKPSVAAVAFSLSLGKLSGFTGTSAWESPWFQILGLSRAAGDELAREASRRGWIDYRRIGEVSSLTFRGLGDELKIDELS